MQGFAKTGDVAMAKNAESAAAQAVFLAVDLDILIGQKDRNSYPKLYLLLV